MAFSEFDWSSSQFKRGPWRQKPPGLSQDHGGHGASVAKKCGIKSCNMFQWIGLREIYRKPLFLPSNIGGSCKFSNHPVLWMFLIFFHEAIDLEWDTSEHRPIHLVVLWNGQLFAWFGAAVSQALVAAMINTPMGTTKSPDMSRRQPLNR